MEVFVQRVDVICGKTSGYLLTIHDFEKSQVYFLTLLVSVV